MDYTVERIEKTADAKDFARKYVDPEKFLRACEACPNFGKFWSCPPYAFDVKELWGRYTSITVVCSRICFTGDRSFAQMLETMEQIKAGMAEEMARREAEEPGSLALYAGRCTICRNCGRPEGIPCRNPDKMRYSIESLGGDVVGTIKDLFGFEMEWKTGDTLPEHLILAAGLLR